MSNKRVYSLAAACCALSLSPFAATLADEAPIEEGERCLSSRSISRTEVIDDQNVFSLYGAVRSTSITCPSPVRDWLLTGGLFTKRQSVDYANRTTSLY